MVSHIREVLKAQASYTEAVSIPHNEEDPIRYFLTASHKGNAVLYAATAVQALRAYGIPARYAEGYYLPASKIKAGMFEAAVLTGENAHAWAEVYFDGIGWLPIDVRPDIILIRWHYSRWSVCRIRCGKPQHWRIRIPMRMIL